MMSTDAPSLRSATPLSMTREERAARNGRGMAFAGLGFGIYLLLIALLMLWPHPEDTFLAAILIGVIGLFFTVTGARGVARSSKRLREFNATGGELATGG
jgi:predicted lysophospholipase L1 biosynthesis ABC-type transport system permease subunit